MKIKVRLFIIILLLFMFVGCGAKDVLEIDKSMGEIVQNEEIDNGDLFENAQEQSISMQEDSSIDETVLSYKFAIDDYDKGNYLEAFLVLRDMDELLLSKFTDAEKKQRDEILVYCQQNFEKWGEEAFVNKDYDLASRYWCLVKEWKNFDNKLFYTNTLTSGRIYRTAQGKWYPEKKESENYIEIEGTSVNVVGTVCPFLLEGKYEYQIVFLPNNGSGGSLLIDSTDVIIEQGVYAGTIILYLTENSKKTSDVNNLMTFYNYVEEESISTSEPTKVEPYIGMTKAQLTESAWGEPYRTNISQFEFGTYEQWCYSENRYVYVKDGIVTSIQYSE